MWIYGDICSYMWLYVAICGYMWNLMIGRLVDKQWLWSEPLYIRDPTLTPVPSPGALSLFGHYGNPQTS